MSSEATVRLRGAVRESCRDIEPGQVVVIACSGGADSLALAAGAAWVAQRDGWVAAAVIVDHGLQETSGDVARWAGELCSRLGLDPVRVVRAEVGSSGGPEAAARDARYAALTEVAEELGAAAVLLGHTRDDQAETVLLRLARGSGARSLAAMAPVTGRLRRPLLGLPRALVRASATEVLEPLGESPWEDPHNDDDRFARVRVRRVLADLNHLLGPGATLGLARSAALLRDDADALDDLAEVAVRELVEVDAWGVRSASCASLAALARAVRTRVLRAMCRDAGSPGEDLDVDHVLAVERLVTAWTGQGAVALPGRVTAGRAYGRLQVHPGTGLGDDIAP